MKPKALVWLDKNFIMFGMIQKLQSMFDCEKYAIIDGLESQKVFFTKQQLVNFKKTWYYADLIQSTNQNPDLKYLQDFEKKYGINLWQIAYSDRLFYSLFNKYHTFTKNEILLLLEKEAKLFENLIEEIKPDFLFINVIVYHHAFLLYQICKAKKIKILTLEPTHFGPKWEVKDEVDKHVDVYSLKNFQVTKNRTLDELRNFLYKYKPLVHGHKENTKYNISKFDKIESMVKFVIEKNFDYEKHYSTKGKTKSNVLRKGTRTLNTIKRKQKESFINKNFSSQILNEKFIYFPLTYEPERMVLMGAPYYSNQISVISNIAKSIPVEFILYVKEHPGIKAEGWRNISFYQQIIDLPNVKLIHPSVSHIELIEKSSLVMTIRGTAGLEAAFYNKPSIIFSDDSGYSGLHSVFVVKDINNLSSIIRNWFQRDIDVDELNKYVEYTDNNSFYFDHVGFTSELAKRFNFGAGYMTQVRIEPNEMMDFLSEFDTIFSNLANNYLKYIKN
jgi:hypothetical protein